MPAKNNTITFEAEVLEVRAKKDGIDRLYRVVLQTDQVEALNLQEYICKDTITIRVDERSHVSMDQLISGPAGD